MKTGLVLKNTDVSVSDEDMALINQYTRRQLKNDEVYVFSVVLCDNDIDRDYERFTVESLFELQKLFVGKTGIFDHNMSAKNQTARIFYCEVESVSERKTITGDDYFRLKAKAYIPKMESTADLIMSIDSGIVKEVSVGCAVKSTVCSICSNDVHSTLCNHTKGHKYNGQLCYGEMIDVFDAYEFSFVAVPAQKYAGVVKSYKDKKERFNMNDILRAIEKCDVLSLEKAQCEKLHSYIKELQTQAQYGKAYRESLETKLVKAMSIKEDMAQPELLCSIAKKLSISELVELCKVYKVKDECKAHKPQLSCRKTTEHTSDEYKNHFTI